MSDELDDDYEVEMLLLTCDICGKREMEGYEAAHRFYCSVPCLASDRTLTPEQALTARHTEHDLDLDASEVDTPPTRCPRCGSDALDQFLWNGGAGCRWPVGQWDPWHLPNGPGRSPSPTPASEVAE